MQNTHYVYRLESSIGEYYIGSRSCDVAAEKDSYKGSGGWCSFVRKNKIPVAKTILSLSRFERGSGLG